MKIKKEEIASLMLGFGIIILWYEGYKLSCFSFIFPLIIWGFIFHGFYNFRIIKRECEANCYFKKSSFFYRLFTKRVLIFLISFIFSSILTVAFLIFVTDLTTKELIILFADIFLLILLYEILSKNDSFEKSISPFIIKNMTAWINSIFLTILFFIFSLYQTPPEYIHDSLIQTVNASISKSFSQCEYINLLLSYIKYIQSIQWWFILKFSLTDIKSYIKEMVWIIFLIGNYLSILAFSKYILEIKTFTQRVVDGK